MRVECDVEHTELDGDYGTVEGICVTCGRCDHRVEVYGTTNASIRRGLATLREECPQGENNFYAPRNAGS
jgi:hypothetical protein